MKSLSLLLLLAIIVAAFTSGCLSSTPEKKAVTTPVATSVPVTRTILPPSPSLTVTPVQTIESTPEVTFTYNIPEPTITTPSLRVIKYNEARPEVGRLIITGIAKNDGKISVPRAEVRIKFYDANNNVITSAKTATDNFEPGGTWEFTIEYPGTDSRKVYSYKVSIAEVSP